MKKSPSTVRVRLVLLSLALAAIAVNIWYGVGEGMLTKRRPKFNLSEYLAQVDTHGAIPGNPDKTIERMKALYAKFQIYRKRHGGRFPRIGENSIMTDMMMNYKEYGFGSIREARDAFINEDSRFSDDPNLREDASTSFVYRTSDIRYDGTLCGSPKAPKTRDVVAWTNLYVHRNSTIAKGTDGVTPHPVGFYLVLWDDGEVSKVAWDKVRIVSPNGGNANPEYFEGQAGLPTQGSISLSEYESSPTP